VRLFIDLDSQRLVTSAGTRDPLTSLSFKRGDSARLEIQFIRGAVAEELQAGAAGAFGVKADGKYDSAYLVYSPEWVKEGEGVEALYVFEPSFNTTGLNDLLGHGDGDDSNDEELVTLMAEIEWTVGGAVFSTQTIKALVYNDVIKDGEPPDPLTGPQWAQLNEEGQLLDVQIPLKVLRVDVLQDFDEAEREYGRANLGAAGVKAEGAQNWPELWRAAIGAMGINDPGYKLFKVAGVNLKTGGAVDPGPFFPSLTLLGYKVTAFFMVAHTSASYTTTHPVVKLMSYYCSGETFGQITARPISNVLARHEGTVGDPTADVYDQAGYAPELVVTTAAVMAGAGTCTADIYIGAIKL